MFSVIMWHLLAAVILIRGYQAPPRNQQYTTTHQHQQCVWCSTVSTLKRFKYDVPVVLVSNKMILSLTSSNMSTDYQGQMYAYNETAPHAVDK